ncbi:glyoxylate/hydroxypyruvate reductase A-like [Centruroides vittatus]|uniref:glyoxylate/hydroxypyruvate reductase A-like n=1 Tax=Centruroides vittatus TaxID=120091 RepID=UPI003510A49A
MESDTIYVVSQVPNLGKLLQERLPHTRIKNITLPEQFDWHRVLDPKIIDLVKDAEILFCDNTSVGQLMYSLPKLKWVQTVWAGVDSIFRRLDPGKTLPGFTLTRYGDSRFGDTMAEYFLAQVINNERFMYEMWDNQKISKWRTEVFMNCRTVSELIIGIMGIGVLGGQIAKAVKERGATVYGLARKIRKNSDMKYCDKIFTNLSEFLKDCDYVCSVLPSTHLTRGLLNGNALESCEKKPVFVSMGRGDVIDEEDLLRAIEKNWIRKAILDVFKEEPLPADSVLWSHPKIIVTPHIGGSTNTFKIIECFMENYKRFRSGRELLNRVDWNEGY